MSTARDMDTLLRRFADNTVPGCACMVMKDGQPLYENYFGYRDLEAKLPVNRDTLALVVVDP